MSTLSAKQVETVLQQHPDIQLVKVEGDGRHFTATIVSDVFVNQPKVKRQQWVYALLSSHILSGALHAIQLNTWTQEEWQKIGVEHRSQE